MVRLPDGTSVMVRGAGTSLRLRRGLSYGIPIRRRRRGIGFTSSGRGARVGGTPMERKKRGVRQRRSGRCRDVGDDEDGEMLEIAGRVIVALRFGSESRKGMRCPLTDRKSTRLNSSHIPLSP